MKDFMKTKIVEISLNDQTLSVNRVLECSSDLRDHTYNVELNEKVLKKGLTFLEASAKMQKVFFQIKESLSSRTLN